MDELNQLIRQESHLHDPKIWRLHPRARLRVSPGVLNELMKMYIVTGSFLDPPQPDGQVMGIPVTVDAAMEPGSWQLIAGEGTI
jgi:hypothetical protein